LYVNASEGRLALVHMLRQEKAYKQCGIDSRNSLFIRFCFAQVKTYIKMAAVLSRAAS
jgi:hypothetical protein